MWTPGRAAGSGRERYTSALAIVEAAPEGCFAGNTDADVQRRAIRNDAAVRLAAKIAGLRAPLPPPPPPPAPPPATATAASRGHSAGTRGSAGAAAVESRCWRSNREAATAAGRCRGLGVDVSRDSTLSRWQ